MRILVTDGVGFIGSRTPATACWRWHDVVGVDALGPPVHRGRRPSHLGPGADLYRSDNCNRDLLTNLLRRVDAIYHFAAYRNYLPDFARFSGVNVASAARVEPSR